MTPESTNMQPDQVGRTPVLVMAGGLGTRMRVGHPELPKPLIPIAGVPLIERVLRILVSQGFRNFHVSISGESTKIERFLRDSCSPFVSSKGGSIMIISENKPLGTIGCASRLAKHNRDVLVVNADNLTTLDHAKLLESHLSLPETAMTIATHTQSFIIPWGEIRGEQGVITAYDEKPDLKITISSGAYVLGRAALVTMPQERRCDVPELVNTLIEAGMAVRSYGHQSPWIDVNDDAAARSAEQNSELVKDYG